MGTDPTRQQFVCPTCEGTVPISPEIRRALVRNGCVLCGSPVTAEAFPA